MNGYRKARSIWAEFAERARDVYVRDITFGGEKHLRGHWLDRLPAIDRDIADMEKAGQKERPSGSKDPLNRFGPEMFRALIGPAQRPPVTCDHTPPAAFRPGKPLTIGLSFGRFDAASRPIPIWLHYRHVNQAENYRVEKMQTEDRIWLIGEPRTTRARSENCWATIPAEYTNSPYPLEYYFVLREPLAQPQLYPGFKADLCNQPYFVVRPACVYLNLVSEVREMQGGSSPRSGRSPNHDRALRFAGWWGYRRRATLTHHSDALAQERGWWGCGRCATLTHPTILFGQKNQA